MLSRERLRGVLVDEAWAYGYTLTIWGAGALLIAEYGVPSQLDVLGYVAGSLVGFGLLTWYAFRGLLVGVEHERRDVRTAAQMVHLGATFLNLVGALVFVRLAHGVGVPEPVTFALVGFQATIVYSLFLVVEEELGRRLR